MLIKVKVHPNSKTEEIKELSPECFEVRIKQKPQDGKANLALLKLLCKHFLITRNQITIKSGFKCKDKLIEIDNS